MNPLLTAPIGATLFRLATPMVFAMVITLATSVAETWYVGQLGTAALAGLALAFPMMMLMLMLSGGSVGGAIAGAVAQQLGASDRAGAESVLLHAVVMSVVIALLFSAAFLVGGTAIYSALGGTDDVLAAALRYSDVLFAGCVLLWISNCLSAAIRATGQMKVAAGAMVGGSLVQILAAGVLVFGLGPFPKLGIAGAAAGVLIGNAFGCALLLYFLVFRCEQLRLRWHGIRADMALMADLLKVSALASIAPLSTIATVAAVTAFMARLGVDVLAGYGIGARIEFLTVPLVFGIGAAAITMVGVHFGAGEYRRGLRIGWTAGIASACIAGALGMLLALFPGVWTDLFTDSPEVRQACRAYLRIVGPSYAFYGLGLCFYFASQGARRMAWPVAATVLRLAIVLVGGLMLNSMSDSSAEDYFVLIAVAMTIYGVSMAIAIHRGAWTRGLVLEHGGRRG